MMSFNLNGLNFNESILIGMLFLILLLGCLTQPELPDTDTSNSRNSQHNFRAGKNCVRHSDYP